MKAVTDVWRMMARTPGYLGLLAVNFCQGMAYSFVVPFMSKWGTEAVGMSPRFFGIFMTVTSLSAITLSTVLARWSDTHLTRRTMLLTGGLGGTLGYLSYAYVSNPWILMLCGCLLLGLASVNFSQIFAHLREDLSRPENAKADAPLLMSIARVAFSLAWIVGPTVGAWVKVISDFRGCFLSAAGLFFLFTLGVFWQVPHRPHPPLAHQKPKTPFFDVVRQPVIFLSFVGFMLCFSAHMIGVMNLPLLVTGELRGTDADVGIIYGIAPAVEVPLMIWTGRLAAQGHMMTLLRWGAAACALYFCGLPFVQAPWHVFPLQILSAVAIGILTNITITYFQDLLPHQPGLAASIYSNAFNVGSLLGYFTFGQLLPVLGQRDLFWVCAGFGLTTLVILMGLRHETPPPQAGLRAQP